MSARQARQILDPLTTDEFPFEIPVLNDNAKNAPNPSLPHFDANTLQMLLPLQQSIRERIIVEDTTIMYSENGFRWVQRELKFVLGSGSSGGDGGGLHMAGISFESHHHHDDGSGHSNNECNETAVLLGAMDTCDEGAAALMGDTFKDLTRDGERQRSALNIVALHGWLDNANTFRPLAPLLLEHLASIAPDLHVRIVALDMIGCGKSDHHPLHEYSIHDVLFHTIQVCNILRWTRFGMLGHSFGGALATVMPSIIPESRLAFVITLDVLGFESLPDESSPHRVLRRAMVQRLKVQYDHAVGGVRRNMFRSKEQAARKLMSRYEHGLSFDGAMHLVERGTKTIIVQRNDGNVSSGPEKRYIFSYDSKGQLVSLYYRFTVNQMKAFIKQIQCPFLALLPQRGTGWPYAEPYFEDRKRLLMESNKSGLVKVIHSEGTGHHFHLDYPDVVARDVAAFLTEFIARERKRQACDDGQYSPTIQSKM